MKKVLSVFLALAMLVCFAGCRSNAADPGDTTTDGTIGGTDSKNDGNDTAAGNGTDNGNNVLPDDNMGTDSNTNANGSANGTTGGTGTTATDKNDNNGGMTGSGKAGAGLGR